MDLNHRFAVLFARLSLWFLERHRRADPHCTCNDCMEYETR